MHGRTAVGQQKGDPEKRLEARVIEQVVPTLAEGFLADLRRRNGRRSDLSCESLNRVFQGTQILLYRLLFLFNAESRGLLPVERTRGYCSVSLARLIREVAAASGTTASRRSTRLAQRYREGEYELFTRLRRLFRLIEHGDALLDVPPFGGSLFLSAPDPADESPEAQIARFLDTTAVPDHWLAPALDLLAREEEPGSPALVFIDYASLDVRLLGSIHEALLARQVTLAAVQGSEHPAIRLARDRRRRKASGSFYTPPEIVSYLVEQTVGPVLQARLEAMRPRFLQVQQERPRASNGREIAMARSGGDGERIGRELLDELLDFRVLDPAMGAGVFLVETVNLVAERVLGFLASFPGSPVHAELAATRTRMVRALQPRGATTAVDRLTDLELLRRLVLKRCIYGVDLDPLAVELAKISLWLECCIPGLPLCFLEHHLCCGNSLFGATLSEAGDSLGEAHLSGSLPSALRTAAEKMRAVSGAPDLTHEQLLVSRAEYHRARDLLSPYVSHLDRRTVGACRSGTLTRDAAGDADHAPRVARQQRIFHWELAFPEVFFGAAPGGDVTNRRARGDGELQKRETAGFHAVVGNPPYLNVKRGMEPVAKQFLERRYALAAGQWDQGALFYELALGTAAVPGVAADTASVGLIVPKPFFLAESYHALRELLLESGEVVYGPCGECFAEAGVEASIGIVRRARRPMLRIVEDRAGVGFSERGELPAEFVGRLPFRIFSYLLSAEVIDALYTPSHSGDLVPLGTVVRWTRGVEAGKRDAAVVEHATPGASSLIVGEAVRPFQARPTACIRVDQAAAQKFKSSALYARRPKLLLRRVAATLVAAVDESRSYVLNTLYVGQPRQAQDEYALAALLNSTVSRGILKGVFNLDDALFPYLRISQLDRLPIPAAAIADAELGELGRLLSSAAAEVTRAELLLRLEQRVGRLYGLPAEASASLSALGGGQAQVAAAVT